MTKIEERSREIVELLRTCLDEETGNTASYDVQRIVVCHEELAMLHTFSRAGVTRRFTRFQHDRAKDSHARVAKSWNADLQSGGLIHTFGESKTLRWVLLNYIDSDNGGHARRNYGQSRKALSKTVRIKEWSDRDYAWRAPDLSPDCPDGTCR